MELRAEKKKRILKSKGTLRDLWDNIKQNIFIYRGARRRRGRERDRKVT